MSYANLWFRIQFKHHLQLHHYLFFSIICGIVTYVPYLGIHRRHVVRETSRCILQHHLRRYGRNSRRAADSRKTLRRNHSRHQSLSRAQTYGLLPRASKQPSTNCPHTSRENGFRKTFVDKTQIIKLLQTCGAAYVTASHCILSIVIRLVSFVFPNCFRRLLVQIVKINDTQFLIINVVQCVFNDV